MSAIRYTILIPTHHSDGKPAHPALAPTLAQEWARIAGGSTLEDAAEGRWIDQKGNAVCEGVRALWCVVTADDQTVARERLRSTARYLAERLAQECVYFSAEAVKVEFIMADD